MRSSFRILVLLLLSLGGFWPSSLRASEHAALPAAGSSPKLDRVLLREVLRASGVADPERRETFERTFEILVEDLARRVGTSRSRYRVARRLHDHLHQRVMRRYESTADGLDSVLGRGEFNCLSASLLYGLLGRALGLEVQVVEIPRHVYVRFLIDQRRVEVETTSRTGFDLRPKLLPAPGLSWDPGYGADARAGTLTPGVAEAPVPEGVNLERAVAFLWHNAGRRALEQGDAPGAARSFLEESRLAPEKASRSESLGVYLARAFRMEYEAGRFESAYRIAGIGMEIFPAQTTAKDRLLAAALKRIEASCEADRTSEAEKILDEAALAVGNAADSRRLERGACPLITAAAVRAGDWLRAERMALRFSAAEPDGVESRRLSRWVSRREQEVLGSLIENACVEPSDGSFDHPFSTFSSALDDSAD